MLWVHASTSSEKVIPKSTWVHPHVIEGIIGERRSIVSRLLPVPSSYNSPSLAEKQEKAPEYNPISIPRWTAGKTYEAREFDLYLADVRTVSEIPGTDDVIVMRRIPKDQIESYMAGFDRMELRRVVDGWIKDEVKVIGMGRPPQYADRTEKDTKTGRLIGPVAYFGQYYEKLAQTKVITQRDLRELDFPFYSSLDRVVQRDGNRLSTYFPSSIKKKRSIV